MIEPTDPRPPDALAAGLNAPTGDAAPATPELLSIDEPSGVGVYGAPRPAVPQRLAVTPRHRGCGSGAGAGDRKSVV